MTIPAQYAKAITAVIGQVVVYLQWKYGNSGADWLPIVLGAAAALGVWAVPNTPKPPQAAVVVAHDAAQPPVQPYHPWKREQVPDQAVTTLLTGAGGAIAIAGVWLLCIITGLMVPGRSYARLEKENDDLKAALDAQARRADAAVEAAHTTNLILAGIRREASGP